MKSTIHNFLIGKSYNSCKKTVTLFAALLLGTFFLNAQWYLVHPAKYGDGSLLFSGQRTYNWDNDTLKWDNVDSFTFQYTPQVWLKNTKKYDYSDNTGSFDYVEDRAYEYTPTGFIAVLTDSFLLSPSSCEKYEYTYNSGNQRTLLITKIWNNVQSAWFSSKRTQTNFTAFDSINVELGEVNIGSVWTNNFRYLHAYNAQNRDTSITLEYWNANQWRGNQRTLQTLNANGQVTSTITQKYDTTSGTYKNDYAHEFVYDGSNRIISDAYSIWNTGNNGWEGEWRKNYAYNTNGDLENILREDWDVNSLQWYYYSLETYTYDAAHRLTNILSQKWIGSVLVNNNQNIFTYNTHGYITKWTFQVWDNNALAWKNNSEEFYWYQPNPFNGVEDVKQDNLSVFPNPSNSPVTFVNADKNLPYEVYDMQGRLIVQGTLQPGTNNIILNEPKGMYLLKAGNAVARIVKE
ncbi:MAG: T9SS type A sorting domain-containing protein [Chitinophagales bacterium]|nr:T9SS type A sorting domain-containing protein [Chitinophagales bacterium]